MKIHKHHQMSLKVKNGHKLEKQALDHHEYATMHASMWENIVDLRQFDVKELQIEGQNLDKLSMRS